MQGSKQNQLLYGLNDGLINKSRFMKRLSAMNNTMTDACQFLKIGHGFAFAQQLTHACNGLFMFRNRHVLFYNLFRACGIIKCKVNGALFTPNQLYQT